MLEMIRDLAGDRPGRPFVPCFVRGPGNDTLMYLSEDVGYRTKAFDARMTLLLHPQEDRIVGVQLHGATDEGRFARLSSDKPAVLPMGYSAPLEPTTTRELIIERHTRRQPLKPLA